MNHAPSVALLFVALYAVGVRATPPADPQPSSLQSASTRRVRWEPLLWICVLLGVLRFALAQAFASTHRDVFGYLALASFAKLPGESAFSCLPTFRAHTFVFFPFAGDASVTFANAVTSGVVVATGAVLATVCWRLLDARWPALLAPPLYVLGTLPFQGLTANAEPYACLGLAGFLAIRLGAPHPASSLSFRRSALAGACLGFAFACKEHCAPFVLAEPLLLCLLCWGRGLSLGRFVRCELAAALGFAVFPGLLLLGLAASGELGAFLDTSSALAFAGGDVPDAAQVETRRVVLASGSAWSLWLELFTWCFGRVVSTPVGLLALGSVIWLVRPSPQRRAVAGLALVLGLALATASIGFRFYGHYYLLVFPALVPLAVLFLAALVRDLRPAGLRAVLCVAGVTLLCAHTLLDLSAAEVRGADPTIPGTAQVCEFVRSTTPPHSPIYVAGWYPQLYPRCDRVPASRCVTGGGFRTERILGDFLRHRPTAVVVPRPYALPGRHTVEGSDLVRYLRSEQLVYTGSPLQAWLDREGYRLALELPTYRVYLPSQAR